MTNSRLLRARMIEKGYTIESLAQAMGFTNATLSRKINNRSEFWGSEIRKISEILDIEDKDAVFFCRDVGK